MKVPVVLALAAALTFGSATPFSKMLLGAMPPFVLAGFLYLGAAIALFPFALKRGLGRTLRGMSGKNRLRVFGAIVFGGILGPAFMLTGLTFAASGSVSLWLNLELVATALLGHFLFKDKMTKTSALAAAGILLASLILTFDGQRGSLVGGAFVAAACVCWGLDNHCSALIDGLAAEESTFLKGVVAGGFNLILGLSVAGVSGLSAPSIAGAILLGAFAYGISIVLYVSAAHGLGATRAQLWFSSSPVFGLLLAFLLLGDPIQPRQLVAFAVMALSWLALSLERHAHVHAHQATVHTHWHKHDDSHHAGHHDHPFSLATRLVGHNHDHVHDEREHAHPHVSDIHHRHEHVS